MSRFTKVLSAIMVVMLISALSIGQSMNYDQKRQIQLMQEKTAQDVIPGLVPVSAVQSDFDYTQVVNSDGAKDILWDNGGLITQAGVGSGGTDYSDLQDASLGMGTYGFGFQTSAGNSLADDFDVVGNWVVNTITFYGYQTGSGPPSTLNEVVFQVYDGDPNAGGAVIFGDMTTNVMVSTTWTNIWRTLESGPTENRPIMEIVADASGLVLPTGTYWVQWSVGGSGASGPWAPAVTIPGEATTGNAYQNTGAWAPAVDGGTSTPQGFPFIIDGVNGSLCKISLLV